MLIRHTMMLDCGIGKRFVVMEKGEKLSSSEFCGRRVGGKVCSRFDVKNLQFSSHLSSVLRVGYRLLHSAFRLSGELRITIFAIGNQRRKKIIVGKLKHVKAWITPLYGSRRMFSGAFGNWVNAWEIFVITRHGMLSGDEKVQSWWSRVGLWFYVFKYWFILLTTNLIRISDSLYHILKNYEFMTFEVFKEIRNFKHQIESLRLRRGWAKQNVYVSCNLNIAHMGTIWKMFPPHFIHLNVSSLFSPRCWCWTWQLRDFRLNLRKYENYFHIFLLKLILSSCGKYKFFSIWNKKYARIRFLVYV